MARAAAQPAAPAKPSRTLKRDVPYVPTEQPVLRRMLELARIQHGDVLYDLGCGDGRIAIAAAREHGVRAVGIDIDPERIKECHRNAEEAGVAGQVRFICGSLFDLDLREASVVTLYLLPSLNQRLRPKLQAELRPGSRVISNHFDMGAWQPDEQASIEWRHLYKWIVPAWVGGKWRCYINHPEGRRSIVLEVSRFNQLVQGTARVGPLRIPVVEGRLCGDELTFRLVQPRDGVVRYTGKVEGTRMTGTCSAKEGGRAMAWAGLLREDGRRSGGLRHG